MATKKRKVTAVEDARRGGARFVDQPGQWRDISSPSVKKRREAGLKKLKKDVDARLAKEKGRKK